MIVNQTILGVGFCRHEDFIRQGELWIASITVLGLWLAVMRVTPDYEPLLFSERYGISCKRLGNFYFKWRWPRGWQ